MKLWTRGESRPEFSPRYIRLFSVVLYSTHEISAECTKSAVYSRCTSKILYSTLFLRVISYIHLVVALSGGGRLNSYVSYKKIP